MKQLKSSQSIKLYRPVGFKIICFVLFLLILFVALFNICDLIGTGFVEYFFGNPEFFNETANAGSASFFVGLENIFVYFLNIPYFIFLLYLLFISVFCNKIVIKGEKVWLFFAPRLFYKTNINNISVISPINSNDIPWYKKMMSFNFQKDNLYHFLCYNSEFFVSGKDTEKMKIFMDEVNSRHNITEKDEPDYNPAAFSKGEKIAVGIIAIWIISLIYQVIGVF